MVANTLFIRLEAPLQSWGERARWSIRDTASEPTKSGIVGLLACALGLNSDDELQALSRSIRVGIRCDRPGVVLRDYHTVVGGVLSAEGKIKINANTKEPETVVSERFYITDASFLVAVRTAPEQVTLLRNALLDPIWPFFLGRKSCPPANPVYEGEGDFSSLEEALSAIPAQSRQTDNVKEVRLRAVLECGLDDENAKRRRDEVDSRERRTFQPRYVREIMLTVPAKQEAS